MLSHFSALQAFAIHSHDFTIFDADDWRDILFQLPKTLESLRIESKCHLPDLEELLSSEADPPLPNAWFSRLHTLSVLADHLASTHQWFNVPHSIFPAESLTCLTLPHRDSNGNLFSTLPRSLVKLDFAITWHSPAHLLQDWLYAPPNLEYIRRIRWNSRDLFPKLPNFDVTIGSLRFKTVSWTPDAAATIPVNTQSLSFGSYQPPSFAERGTNWATELPRRLKSLKFGYHGSDQELLSYTNYLPPSLTELRIKKFTVGPQVPLNRLERLTKAKAWPLNLRSLAIDRAPIELIPLLPDSLTLLDLCFSENATPCLAPEKLPPNISSLELRGCSTDCLLRTSSDNWPPNLHSLSCDIDWDDCDNFPPLLTLLNMSRLNKIPLEDGPFMLPIRLIDVHLTHWHQEWFGALPRALTRLSLLHLHTTATEYFDEGVDAFDALPPSLTCLKVPRALLQPEIKGVFSSASFANLPNLTHLELVQCNKFKSGCLRNLPRGLKTLRITLQKLEDEDLPYIPPNLIVFEPNVYFDLSSDLLLKHWPANARKV